MLEDKGKYKFEGILFSGVLEFSVLANTPKNLQLNNNNGLDY